MEHFPYLHELGVKTKVKHISSSDQTNLLDELESSVILDTDSRDLEEIIFGALNTNEISFPNHDSNQVLTELPDDTLGINGILNSLLDIELTRTNSSSNDFMYYNVKSIDPHSMQKDQVENSKCSGNIHLQQKSTTRQNDSIKTGRANHKLQINNQTVQQSYEANNLSEQEGNFSRRESLLSTISISVNSSENCNYSSNLHQLDPRESLLDELQNVQFTAESNKDFSENLNETVNDNNLTSSQTDVDSSSYDYFPLSDSFSPIHFLDEKDSFNDNRDSFQD